MGSWSPVVGQNTMVAGCEANELSTSWQKQSKEGKEGTRNHVKISGDPIPPAAKPHLLKFPESPKIPPSAVTVTLHIRACGGQFTFKPSHTL